MSNQNTQKSFGKILYRTSAAGAVGGAVAGALNAFVWFTAVIAIDELSRQHHNGILETLFTSIFFSIFTMLPGGIVGLLIGVITGFIFSIVFRFLSYPDMQRIKTAFKISGMAISGVWPAMYLLIEAEYPIAAAAILIISLKIGRFSGNLAAKLVDQKLSPIFYPHVMSTDQFIAGINNQEPVVL